jgi:hypothetical protein
MTNRELYLLVTDRFSKYSQDQIPSLEKYLKSLWAIASPFSRTEPTLKNLANWLDLAFTYPPPNLEPQWLDKKPDLKKTGFEAWENTILLQIVDLYQMSETGQLKDEMRYFGINSPGGSRWYNFDVLSYLECAVRGMYGGYEEDEVIILQPSPEGESDDSDIFEIKNFSWEDFGEFLWTGQIYE